MHPASLPTDELLAECTLRARRRGGPGGQHRNKVETAVVVEHTPTGLRAEASERRSQADNRRVAINRLRMLLAVEYRQTSGGEEPSSLWKSRVAGNRIDVSVEHDDFPAILAELLDRLSASSFDTSAASDYFSVTSSQLVSLLRSYPPALSWVNTQRAAHGLASTSITQRSIIATFI